MDKSLLGRHTKVLDRHAQDCYYIRANLAKGNLRMQDLLEKVDADWLLTIYAPLLTETQRRIAELYYAEDWTAAEIAAEQNVSRQAVFVTLHRVSQQLHQLEKQLGLRTRMQEVCSLIRQIHSIAECTSPDSGTMETIRQLSRNALSIMNAEPEYDHEAYHGI